MRETVAYIALGANLGDRLHALRQAVEALSGHPGITGLRASPLYESAAHTLDPGEEQPPFLNAVVEVRTSLAPDALLALCHVLEQQAGRVRERPWAPRTLDLDLLFYGAEQRHEKGLELPHPRLAERMFVLQPLFDLAPDRYVPPPFDATVAELRDRCPDTQPLARISDAWSDV